MKNFMYFILLICMLSFFSCATVPMVTDFGNSIGKSFQESSKKGEKAQEYILAWPYAYGTMKSLMGPSFEMEMNPAAMFTIKELNKLAERAKEGELTPEERGTVMGSFVKLEILAFEQSWSRYDINIFRTVTGFIGF